MTLQSINIAQKLKSFSDHWNPRIIAELNGQQVKVAKLKGEFVMHQHDDEDELFYVIKGQLLMRLPDQTMTLNPGEMVVIPKGTPHQPVAIDEVEVLLFEPASTVNTGNENNDLTRTDLDRI